ncbi:MAG TPA: response regulator transcription factor [Acidimicrobiales bacterium]|nr:response regulator transcription factor [Acidimicrobiales bacterium]
MRDAGPAAGGMEPIRVLVADDHELFRRGLKMVLEAEGDIVVVDQAGDGEAAVTKVGELAPDVVLMDVRMPHMDGLEATRRIRATFPMTRIIVLTVSDEEDDLFDAVKAGANGYLLKEVSIEEVADSVRAVMAGHSLLSPSMAAKLISEFGSAGPLSQPLGALAGSGLSDQELEVLKRVARGLPNESIAAELSVTESAVRNHVANILAKLQLRSRLEAAIVALQEK